MINDFTPEGSIWRRLATQGIPWEICYSYPGKWLVFFRGPTVEVFEPGSSESVPLINVGRSRVTQIGWVVTDPVVSEQTYACTCDRVPLDVTVRVITSVKRQRLHVESIANEEEVHINLLDQHALDSVQRAFSSVSYAFLSAHPYDISNRIKTTLLSYVNVPNSPIEVNDVTSDWVLAAGAEHSFPVRLEKQQQENALRAEQDCADAKREELRTAMQVKRLLTLAPLLGQPGVRQLLFPGLTEKEMEIELAKYLASNQQGYQNGLIDGLLRRPGRAQRRRWHGNSPEGYAEALDIPASQRRGTL